MKIAIVFLVLATAIAVTKGQHDVDTSMCNDVPENETTWHPVPGDCTRYIICNDYDGYVEQCAPGTWWHQQILDCDYPGSYCVPGSTSGPNPPTNPTNRPPTNGPTQKPPTNGPTQPPGSHTDPRCVDLSPNYWPHPAYCHRYIECFQGNSYELQCPPGLFFSNDKKKCVNSDESDCCINSPNSGTC